MHVDGHHSRRPRHVVNEDDQLHPTFPFVGLIPVQKAPRFDLVVEEKTHDEDVQHRDEEVHVRVVLVLLHEVVRPVAYVNVNQNQTQSGQSVEQIAPFVAFVVRRRGWFVYQEQKQFPGGRNFVLNRLEVTGGGGRLGLFEVVVPVGQRLVKAAPLSEEAENAADNVDGGQTDAATKRK